MVRSALQCWACLWWQDFGEYIKEKRDEIEERKSTAQGVVFKL